MHWVFIALPGLSLVAASGGYSLSPCTGFSLLWLLLLWSMGFRHEGFSKIGTHRFSSCGSQAELLHGMWNLPRSGIEPMSPVLSGRFLPTMPPGKSFFLPLNLGGCEDGTEEPACLH